MIEIAFEFTEDDALGLARLADGLSAAGGRTARFDWSNRWYAGFLVALWAVPVGMAGIGALSDVFVTERDFLIAFGASTVWTAALFLKGLYDRRTARGVGAGVIEANRKYGYLGSVRVRIDENGVREVGPGYAVEAGWDKTFLVDRRDGFVFLVLTLGWDVTVPCRAFGSNTEVERFLRFIDERRQATHRL